MNTFAFVNATDEAQAIAAADRPRAGFIAGGTNRVDLMSLGVETPEQLVDINALPLSAIEVEPDGGLKIGAMVRNSDLAHDPRVVQRYPALSQALLSGASPQLRNMATVGGNLLQRTRCSYFREEGFDCNKRRPGSGCAAWGGYNRMHAILGGSEHCIAAHPSDMCVALAALDAVIRIRGPGGTREIPLAELHLLPGDHPELETSLAQGELITHVRLPFLPFAAHSVYVKVRDRASYAFALVSAAAALDLSGGTIRAARVALGGVGTRPWRSAEAEAALVGHPPSLRIFQAAAKASMSAAVPRKYNAFKVGLAQRVVVRALARAGGAQ